MAIVKKVREVAKKPNASSTETHVYIYIHTCTHTHTKAGFTFLTRSKELKSAKDVMHPLWNISNLAA